jgi:hypothetical protein
MNERSDPPTNPLHLVLDFGDTIDVDGSTIWDPIDEVTIPAVTLRLPAHRAAFLGRALDTYTRISHLLGTDPDLTERDLAWALTTAATAAGRAPVDATVMEGAAMSTNPEREQHHRYHRVRETLDEQARRKGAKPLTSMEDLRCDGIFETDEELDEFLEHLGRQRQAARQRPL